MPEKKKKNGGLKLDNNLAEKKITLSRKKVATAVDSTLNIDNVNKRKRKIIVDKVVLAKNRTPKKKTKKNEYNLW